LSRYVHYPTDSPHRASIARTAASSTPASHTPPPCPQHPPGTSSADPCAQARNIDRLNRRRTSSASADAETPAHPAASPQRRPKRRMIVQQKPVPERPQPP